MRDEQRGRPNPAGGPLVIYTARWSESRYVCPNGRHLAIKAAPLETYITQARAAGPLAQVVVSPAPHNGPRWTHARLRVIWTDGIRRPTRTWYAQDRQRPRLVSETVLTRGASDLGELGSFEDQE
jgi:hypothetical protein